MSLESASFITQLNQNWPESTSTASKADDHIIAWKTALQGSFPNINSQVSANSFELNQLVGATLPIQTMINGLDTATWATSADLNDRIRTASQTLTFRVSDMSATIDESIETLSDTLDAYIDNMETSFNAKINSMEAALDNVYQNKFTNTGVPSSIASLKLDISATAQDTRAWGGAHQFCQTATPANAVDGDIWFQL